MIGSYLRQSLENRRKKNSCSKGLSIYYQYLCLVGIVGRVLTQWYAD